MLCANHAFDGARVELPPIVSEFVAGVRCKDGDDGRGGGEAGMDELISLESQGRLMVMSDRRLSENEFSIKCIR